MTHIREIRSEKMAGFRSGEFKSSGSDGAVLRCPSRLTSSISIRVASVVADRRGFYRLRGKKKERRKERKGERFVSERKNTTDWLHNLKWQRKVNLDEGLVIRSIIYLSSNDRSPALFLFLFDALPLRQTFAPSIESVLRFLSKFLSKFSNPTSKQQHIRRMFSCFPLPRLDISR